MNRPRHQAPGTRHQNSIILALVPIVIAATIASGAVITRSLRKADPAIPYFALDLGKIQPAQAAEARLVVKNPHSAPIAVERVASSCDCLSLRPGRFTIPAGGECLVLVLYRPEPGDRFSGELGMSISGIDRDGAIVLQGKVSVAVRTQDGSSSVATRGEEAVGE